IDIDVGASDETIVLVSEEGHQTRNFFRCAVTLHGDGFADGFPHFLGNFHDHVSGNVSRRYRVDRYALGCRLLSQSHGQAMHARLGGGVVDLAELPLAAVDGRYIDNAAVALLEHHLDHTAAGVEDTVEVRINDNIPLFGSH